MFRGRVGVWCLERKVGSVFRITESFERKVRGDLKMSGDIGCVRY